MTALDTKALRKLLVARDRAKAKFDALPKEGPRYTAPARNHAFQKWMDTDTALKDAAAEALPGLLDSLEGTEADELEEATA